MTKIINLITYDLRFPTSDNLDGSDAMNPDPDYSAAYVILESENKLIKVILLLLHLVAATTFVVKRSEHYNIL